MSTLEFVNYNSLTFSASASGRKLNILWNDNLKNFFDFRDNVYVNYITLCLVRIFFRFLPLFRSKTLPDAHPDKVKAATLNTPSGPSPLRETIKPVIRRSVVIAAPASKPVASPPLLLARIAAAPAANAAAKLTAELAYPNAAASAFEIERINAASSNDGTAASIHFKTACKIKLISPVLFFISFKKTPPTLSDSTSYYVGGVLIH